MKTTINRRDFLARTGEAGLALGLPLSLQPTLSSAQSGNNSALRRIKMATVGAPDLAPIEEWYGDWLGYTVVERGHIAAALAQSWGAPANTGRPYLLLQPESGTDVYIRAVEIDAVPDYKAMTSFGWNSIEIIIDDVYALGEKLVNSPFEIIGEPHSLGGGFASIHAMQVIGPAEEVLYLTCETGDRETSNLPLPGAFVDRPFIMILAGPSVDVMRDFYADKFAVATMPNFDSNLGLVIRAQGLPEDHIFPMTLVRGRERGNNIELDGYPESAGPRIHNEGQIPPGVSMTSFSVDDIDALDLEFITPPQPLYGTRRAATFIGPAGELTELIEEPG